MRQTLTNALVGVDYFKMPRGISFAQKALKHHFSSAFLTPVLICIPLKE
jgi:hypothetical protein